MAVTAKSKQQTERKKWLKRFGYAGLIFFGLAYAFAGVADDIASAIRALPAMVDISSAALRIFSLTLGSLATFTNTLVLMIAFPRAIKTLKQLNPLGIFARYCTWKFGLYRLQYHWQNFLHSRGKGAKPDFDKLREKARSQCPGLREKSVLATFFAAFFTGLSFGFFTASSTNTAIIGLAALLGFGTASAGIGLAIVVAALTTAQAVAMFIILAAECGTIAHDLFNKNDKIDWAKFRKFFMIREFAPKNKHDHMVRIFKIGFTFLGGGLIIGAAAFILMGQGESVAEVFANKIPDWITTATQIIVVYIISGLTQVSLSIKGAAEIMGNIGSRLGSWIGKKMVSPQLRNQIEMQEIKAKAEEAKHEKPWQQQSFPEKIQTLLNKVPYRFATLILISASFVGSFFEGMRGDAPLHGKIHNDTKTCDNITDTQHCSFHEINNTLEQQPQLIQHVDRIRPVPVEWQAITAGAFTGIDDALTDAFLLHEKESVEDANDGVEQSQTIPQRIAQRKPYLRHAAYDNNSTCKHSSRMFNRLQYRDMLQHILTTENRHSNQISCA